jgi:ADP-ribose pyrophosphatase YjhB (NUDIX family)
VNKKESNSIENSNLKQTTPFTHEEFYNRYYVHRVAGAALVVKDDKILLVKEIRRGKYFWGVPGGILEKEEALIVGVKREVHEETGVEIEPFCVLGMNNWAGKSIFPDDPYRQCGFSIFLGARFVSGELKPDGEEVKECNFFSVDEIKSFEIAPHLQYILDYYQAYKKKNYLTLSKDQYNDAHSYRYMFKPSNFE